MANKKLSDKEVENICLDLNSGLRMVEIAEKNHVSVAAVSRIYAGVIHSKISEKFLDKSLPKRNKGVVGVKNPSCKLTEDQVRDILKMEKLVGNYKLSVKSVAAEYKITVRALYDILNRISWKHISVD